MNILRYALLLMLSSPLLAQQWSKAGQTGQTVTAIPIGTIVRYGTGAKWVVKPYTSLQTFVIGAGQYPGLAVPSSTAPYELDVWQTPFVQTITVSGIKVTIPIAGTVAAPASTVATVTTSGVLKSVVINVTPLSNGYLAAGSTCLFQ